MTVYGIRFWAWEFIMYTEEESLEPSSCAIFLCRMNMEIEFISDIFKGWDIGKIIKLTNGSLDAWNNNGQSDQENKSNHGHVLHGEATTILDQHVHTTTINGLVGGNQELLPQLNDHAVLEYNPQWVLLDNVEMESSRLGTHHVITVSHKAPQDLFSLYVGVLQSLEELWLILGHRVGGHTTFEVVSV
ncbi:hypothetical protein CR513_10269, partial [Mucuna pruriens]